MDSLSGGRTRTLPGDLGCPVVHELASALEEVRPPIGRLDLVADLVCPRCLRHLAGMIRFLARPVPKARPKGVDAAKGDSRTQRLFIEKLSMIEKERYEEWHKTEHAGQGTVVEVIFSDDKGERDDEPGKGED